MRVEQTPNPLSVKFIPGYQIIPDGMNPSRTFFVTGDPCTNSLFAKATLGIEGIQGVFIARDFITITKTPATDWEIISPHILLLIEAHQGDYIQELIKPVCADDDIGIAKQIKDIIDSRVRPAVAQDGGDIIFESFEEGVVYLKLYGACAGCPSSTITLKSGIENMLKYYVPEVTEVRQRG